MSSAPVCDGDDNFTFSVTVTANGGSAAGWVASNGATGAYGTPTSFTFPLTAPVTLIFTDATTTGCADTLATVTPPALVIECPQDISAAPDEFGTLRPFLCTDIDTIFNNPNSSSTSPANR